MKTLQHALFIQHLNVKRRHLWQRCKNAVPSLRKACPSGRGAGFMTLPLVLAACSHQNDYSPAADATGEQIFAQVCRDCHQPDANGVIYTLKKEKANADYIRKQIKQGSFMMPKFPNMSDEAIKKVSQFVLAHSESQ